MVFDLFIMLLLILLH